MHTGPGRGTAAVLSASLLLGCAAPEAAPRTLAALVAPLPAAVRSAEALLFLDGAPIDVAVRSDLRDGELRLQAQLPPGARGALLLGVGLLDEDGCLVATGAAGADASDEGQLWIPPERSGRDCRRERPLLLGATPGALPLGGAAALQLTGWGFLPGAAVRIAGAPADATWRSPLRIDAAGALPATGLGPVPLSVENPGGGGDQRDDLLRAFLGEVRLGAAEDYAVGRMSAMALGDLDGDGAPELVLSLPQRAEVAVAHNRGDGTFDIAGAPRYAVGQGAIGLALLDLDGDGAPELVTANQGSQDLSVLRGRAGGTFAAAQAQPAGGTPSALAVEDLDGDGRPELVVALSDRDRLRVLRGRDGRLAVEGAADYATGPGPAALAVGDLDGDGAPDLVAVNAGSADLSVLLNRGDGTFPSWLAVRYATGGTPRFVQLGDVNGDGHLDVLTGGGRGGVVLMNGGGGTFPLARRLAFGVSVDAQFATTGDMNGDGRPDLAILTQGGGFATASLLLNRGGGAFDACCSLDRVTGNTVQFVTLGDVDRDGLPDLVLATTASGGQVSIARNRSK